MNIVVLAGGLSPERNVSLSTGVMVTEALRQRGHGAALVDMFFGLEDYEGPLEALFEAPVPEDAKRIDSKAPDLAEVRARRRDKSASLFGVRVLELCALADVVFWPSTGPVERMAGFRRRWICWGFPIPARGVWAAPLLWIRI